MNKTLIELMSMSQAELLQHQNEDGDYVLGSAVYDREGNYLRETKE